MMRLILLIVALWFMWAAMLYSTRAAIEPITPDLKQQYRQKAAKKTNRATPPCMQKAQPIIGVVIVRDLDGQVVAIGALRKRC